MEKVMKQYIHVLTPEESTTVQLLLFSLGYEWASTHKVVVNEDKPFICIDSNHKVLTYSTHDFGIPSYRQITFKDLLKKVIIES
jgi:hypothetical protein